MSLTFLPGLPTEQYHEIADGLGGASAIAHLAEAQLPLHLARLELVRRLAAERRPEASSAADFQASFALLGEIERNDPATVREVIRAPQVGAWAAYCAGLLCRPDVPDLDLTMCLAHLGSIAAVAAIRAGVAVEVPVPTAAGRVLLPTLGSMIVDAAPAIHGARVTTDPAAPRIVVTGRSHPIDSDVGPWRPVRRITAAAGGLLLDVAVDDTDPYLFRGQAGAGPTGAGRSGTGPAWDVTELTGYVGEAWRILVGRHRPYAEGIRQALRWLVPMAGTPGSASAASADAFGAVALSRPVDPAALAVTLLHETQHMKLNGTMALVDLTSAGAGEARYRAPWRGDARPLTGLLHGTYAFAGVADFWRVERTARPGRLADLEFCQWREAVSVSAETMLRSGGLTAAGTAFVVRLRNRVQGWQTETVPAPVAELARDAERDRAAIWRLRNHAVARDVAAALVERYLAGHAPSGLPGTFRIRPGPPSGSDDHRQSLRLRRLRDPAAFAFATRPNADRTAPAAGPDEPDARAELGRDAPADGGSAADLAYLTGSAAAAGLYLAEVLARPDRAAGWAGLALALARDGEPALYDHLETVVAMAAVLRDRGHGVQPRRLAAWLATAPPATDQTTPQAADRAAPADQTAPADGIAPADQIAGSSMSNSTR